jgi:hypothetical protein
MNMNRAIISIILGFSLLFSFSLGFSALAQSSNGTTTLSQSGSGQTTAPASAKTLTNPLKDSQGKPVTSFQQLLGVIINYLMGIIGSVALIMFIVGGLTWLTSGGNSTKVKKGKDIIVWSALGLALIFSSYALVRFLLEVTK